MSMVTFYSNKMVSKYLYDVFVSTMRDRLSKACFDEEHGYLFITSKSKGRMSITSVDRLGSIREVGAEPIKKSTR